ncbi:MAG: hypothetical protein ROO76_15320 [Terriglobia bacterium]|nr:hypothetical protein [Terriglobia bacterium]
MSTNLVLDGTGQRGKRHYRSYPDCDSQDKEQSLAAPSVQIRKSNRAYTHRNCNLKESYPLLEFGGLNDEIVALDRARYSIRIASAGNLIHCFGGEMAATVIADHVVTFLVITLLFAEADIACVCGGTVNPIGALDHEEADNFIVVGFVLIELGVPIADFGKRNSDLVINGNDLPPLAGGISALPKHKEADYQRCNRENSSNCQAEAVVLISAGELFAFCQPLFTVV